MSLGKEDFKHNKLKKNIMERQSNTAQMEQTINTEIQIIEEEIREIIILKNNSE